MDDVEDATSMDVLFAGSGVTQCIIMQYLLHDMTLAIGSLSFVVVCMLAQTKSGWLTFCAISQILASFPMAMLIYGPIIGIPYFGIFNVLAIFIILAIGCDNVFVFTDAFKQSMQAGPEVTKTIVSRLSWAYRRAVSAMFVTSFTTFTAFVCVLPSIHSVPIHPHLHLTSQWFASDCFVLVCVCC
jgi:protein dispatched 1